MYGCATRSQTLRARSEPTVNSPAESEVAAAEQGILGVVVQGCHIVPGGQGRHCQLIASSGSGNVGDRGEAHKCPCSLPQGHLQTLLTHSPTDDPSPSHSESCGCSELWTLCLRSRSLAISEVIQASSSSDVLEGRGPHCGARSAGNCSS